MKKIISARRQNGQAVFFRSTNQTNSMNESQALAFDFNIFEAVEEAEREAKRVLVRMQYQFKGLLDWKIEDVKE